MCHSFLHGSDLLLKCYYYSYSHSNSLGKDCYSCFADKAQAQDT